MHDLCLVVPLPANINFLPETLVGGVPTLIAGMPVGVELPRAVPDQPVLRRPAGLDWQQSEPSFTDGMHPDTDERPESPWGHATSWSADDTAFAVSQVLITLDDVTVDRAPAALKGIREGFPEWFSIVKDWCEVLARQDLDHLSPRPRFRFEGQGWEAWHRTARLRTHGRFRVDFDYGEALTRQRWEAVLALAAEGTRPVIEHLLIRDARAAHARRQYRRAVVDASTALEIALYRLLLEAHRASPSKLADEYVELSQRWGLGTMITNVGKIVTLPASVTTDLAGLRNQVVHRTAREPTEQESTALLAAAEASVALASPVPSEL